MTVKEILSKWLAGNGYDGLCHHDSECGCRLSDLIACDDACHSCTPAYLGPPPDPSDDYPGDFWMYAHKADAENAKDKRGRDGSRT